MKLAFHYHTPLALIDGRMRLPGYLGLFIDAVAREVDDLCLILHEAEGRQIDDADYVLMGENISWISLGRKMPAWHRSLFYRSVLKPVFSEPRDIDILLLRGPGPLAPFFSRYAAMHERIAYMVVSDYGKGAEFITKSGLRNKLVRSYSRWIDRSFKRSLRDQLVIANSREIYNTLRPLTKTICEIKTTTLSRDDFLEREDTCVGEVVRLLFTGRIVLDKGLREIVMAIARLTAEGMSIESHFVGWEDNDQNSVQIELLRLGEELGVKDQLYFHGRKKVGAELNKMYRMGDIYVLPSYHEGFPRTIWEAMANSLPVIATTVGSIPMFLEHGKNALLISPQDVDSLVRSIRQLTGDEELRKKLISNGMDLAKTNTLEIQAKELVAVLQGHLRSIARQ